LGRVVISVFVVVLVLFVAVWQLPPGNTGSGGAAIRRDVMKAGSPVMYALGLDQNWSVFAPPRVTTIAISAQIRYADGTTSTWTPPTSTGALFGEYRDYRWGKYVESLVFSHSVAIIAPLAIWIAKQHNTPGHRPIVVSILQRWYDLKPITDPDAPKAPGSAAVGASAWHTSFLFSLPIIPAMLSPGYVPPTSVVPF
jgi:hypothetical protein